VSESDELELDDIFDDLEEDVESKKEISKKPKKKPQKKTPKKKETKKVKKKSPAKQKKEPDEDDLFGESDKPEVQPAQEVTAPVSDSDEALDLDFEEGVETPSKVEPPKKVKTIKKEVKPKKAKQTKRSKTKRHKYAPPTDDQLDELSSSDIPDWDYSEMDDNEDNTVFVVIGEKGSGKTTLCLSFDKSELPDGDPRKETPTVICIISLDKQSLKIVKKFRQALWDKYPESKGYTHTKYGVKEVKEIHCWNGVRYFIREPPTTKLKSADVTFKYIKGLLDDVIAPLDPDYIIVDGAGRLSWITEYTMRYRNNKSHIDGLKNRNLWKERNDYIDHIFDRVVDYSVVSPLFTLFFKMQQIKDKEEGITYEKQPAWVDRIKEESNMVIELEDELVKGKRMWFGHCQSPKESGWRTDRVVVNTDMLGNGGMKNLLEKFDVWQPPHLKGGTSNEDVF